MGQAENASKYGIILLACSYEVKGENHEADQGNYFMS